jgi:hypothetical protein
MRVEDYWLKVSKTSEIRGRDEGAVPGCDVLGGDMCLAFGVNELRIKIDPAIPFNRIEGNPDPLEIFIVFNSSKYAEIKNRFHVQDPILAVFKYDEKGVIISRNNFFDRGVHWLAPY